MLSEIQNRQIKAYKKMAKKNKCCKYIATGMIVVTIFVGNLLRHNKKVIIKTVQLACFCLLFFVNASFAPPTFQNETQSALAEEENEDKFVESTSEIEDNDVSVKEQISLDDLMEQKEDLIPSDTITNAENTETVAFNRDDWNLLLVNKQHPVPEDYTFTLGTIKGSMQCDERIITPLTEMFTAAKEEGIDLIVCSPYRDLTRQEYLFKRKMKNYLNSGYSYMDAYKNASVTVTVPGASEHQIGLAVDIISDNYNFLDEGFGETEAGIWLKEHSHEFGFILRYPNEKEDITGIQYEPWHYRYVGKDAASIIMDQGITLEEFIENL